MISCNPVLAAEDNLSWREQRNASHTVSEERPSERLGSSWGRNINQTQSVSVQRLGWFQRLRLLLSSSNPPDSDPVAKTNCAGVEGGWLAK